MSVSFQGLHEIIATFKEGTGVAAGMPVKVSGEGTVSACAAGDEFVGVVKSVREGYCAVQLGGYLEVPYSGAAPAFGKAILAGDGSGKVKTNATGLGVTVLHIDSAAGVCGILL